MQISLPTFRGLSCWNTSNKNNIVAITEMKPKKKQTKREQYKIMKLKV